MDCTRCHQAQSGTREFCSVCGAPHDDFATAASPHQLGIWGFLVAAPQGTAESPHWVLQTPEVALGRHGSSASDVTLPHQTVSSSQAVLRCDPECRRASLTDAGSRNGTFINGERLPAHQPCELKDGDLIRFGLYDTQIKIIE